MPSILLLTHFEASSSGLGALGFNGQSFLIQLVTFFIALLILRKWAFKPIMKIMKERRDTIDSGVRLGEEMKQEKAQLEAKVEKTLRDARSQADELIASANQSARQAIGEAETAARQRTEIILKEAQDMVKAETARAKRQLEDELIKLVGEATEAVVRQKIDSSKDNQLIRQFIKERQS